EPDGDDREQLRDGVAEQEVERVGAPAGPEDSRGSQRELALERDEDRGDDRHADELVHACSSTSSIAALTPSGSTSRRVTQRHSLYPVRRSSAARDCTA